MKTTMLFFAAMSIIAQWPHNFWAIDYISNVKEKFKVWDVWEVSPKNIQNYIFCMIISSAIMFLIFLNLIWYAVAGCIIEILINCYYVHCSYEEKYLRVSDQQSKALPDSSRKLGGTSPKLTRKRRSLVGAYFFAVLYPTCIIVFSFIYHSL